MRWLVWRIYVCCHCMEIKYRWYPKARFPIYKPLRTLHWEVIHCIVIVHCAGYRIGWNWTMWNRALHDAKSQNRCVTNCCYQRHPINSNARPKWAMKSCRNVMLASHSHAKMKRCVRHEPNVCMNAFANRAITANIVNSWLMHAMEIHAEMERARCLKKAALVVVAWLAIPVHAAKWTSTIAVKTSAKTIAHASMVWNRTRASAHPDSRANIVKRKFHSVRDSIHARMALNALTISHIIRANVHQAIAVRIAPKISMIAKITCAKMVSFCAFFCTVSNP